MVIPLRRWITRRKTIDNESVTQKNVGDAGRGPPQLAGGFEFDPQSADTANQYRYLFVTGCARSGTSLMANMLRTHPQIAMGNERFARRYYRDAHFPPSLFERERFCRQLLKGDSRDLSLQPYYADLYSRIDRCRYRGDKIPKMASNYAPLLASFIQPKVVYMLRNCFDVANSFKHRAAVTPGGENEWPRDRNAVAAIAEWNLSLRNTLAVLDQIDVMFVVYERFLVEAGQLRRLFDFLGLDIPRTVAKRYAKFAREQKRLEEDREISLTSLEKMHIMRHADFDAYRRAMEIADRPITQARWGIAAR
jgi:Sulfotransferase family